MSTHGRLNPFAHAAAVFQLAVIGGVLLLAHVVIPCAPPTASRMSSKFDAMCRPPSFTAKTDAGRIFRAVLPDQLRLPVTAVAGVVFMTAIIALPALAVRMIQRRRFRFGIRDGTLPFCTSERVFLPAFAAARDH